MGNARELRGPDALGECPHVVGSIGADGDQAVHLDASALKGCCEQVGEGSSGVAPGDQEEVDREPAGHKGLRVNRGHDDPHVAVLGT